MVDFTEALNVKVEDIERPPLAPIGYYTFKVSKPPVFDTVGQGRWEVVYFPLVATEASEDVDPDDLREVGGVSGVRVRKQFMFNKGDDDEAKAGAARTLSNLRTFLEKHLAMDISGMTLKEAIDSSVGEQCMGEVQHRPNPEDPDNPFLDLGRTAPVE